MATPWFDRIRNTGQLSVFVGPNASKGHWARVAPKAITECNRLFSNAKLNITLVPSTTQPATEENDFGGADVEFEAGGGNVKFKVSGQDVTLSLTASQTEGRTRTVAWDFGQGPKIRKAIILVPSTPQALRDLPTPVSRLAGDPVLLCIAVHEFIHAIGLANADHTPDDIFNGSPSLLVGDQNKPDDDRVTVGTTKFPPILLAAATIRKIKQIWP